MVPGPLVDDGVAVVVVVAALVVVVDVAGVVGYVVGVEVGVELDADDAFVVAVGMPRVDVAAAPFVAGPSEHAVLH